MKPTLAQLDSGHKSNWCPGCGNWSILLATKNALLELGQDPKDIVIITGIGCSGKFNHYLKTYGYEGVHGRPLPVATGVKLANNKLTVLAHGGDGDSYGIGMGHFIHTMRRNLNLTYIVHDNQIYGLTKGQTSPTSEKGFKSPSTPFGVIEEPVNPLTLALDSGATYIARGFAGEVKHLTQLILAGIRHKGFALIDIFQPCMIWNKINNYEWFRDRVYKLEETSYQPNDKKLAWEKAQELNKKIPIGLLYQEKKETYTDELPVIKKTPLVEQDIRRVNVTKTLEEFI